MDERKQLATSLAEGALNADFHLACIHGVDAGLVLPVIPGTVIGRGPAGLADPFVSRAHGVIEDVTFSQTSRPQRTLRAANTRIFNRGVIAVLADTDARNPSSTSRRPLNLRKGTTVKLGRSIWQVRPRPGYLNWPAPTSRTTSERALRFGRLLLPLMLVVFIGRLLPDKRYLYGLAALALLTLALIFLSQRNQLKRVDAALLLLVVAARNKFPTNRNEERTAKVKQLHLFLRPGKKKTVLIKSGESVAIVGKDSENYAFWMASQIRALGFDAEVSAATTSSKELRPPKPSSPPPFHFYWGANLADLPPGVPLVLKSHETGGERWLETVATLSERGRGLPESRSFSELLGKPSEELIRETWWNSNQNQAESKTAQSDAHQRNSDQSGKASPRPLSMALSVPIGVNRSGPVFFDLEKDGPHALIVGGTGSGKSEFLTTLVLAYAINFPPSALKMIFVDYKGGAGLMHLAKLPHVEHALTDLDGAKTPWLLRALGAALTTRKQKAASAGFRSLEQWQQAYRAHHGEGLPPPQPPPRLLIVVDEFRLLADTHPDRLRELTAISTQGRSLGMHLVLATQRPSGAITPDMRATIDLRVALRCAEERDSIEVIGSAEAAHLPRIPGRAIMNGTEIQSALATDIDRWVHAMNSAASALFVPKTGSFVEKEVPDPLPTKISTSSLRSFLKELPSRQTSSLPTVGLYEDPHTAQIRPLQSPGGGMIILGPVSHRLELYAYALAVALASGTRKMQDDRSINRRNGPLLWAGPFPPQFNHFRHRFARIAGPDEIGLIAQMLTRIGSALEQTDTGRGAIPLPILVLADLSSTLSRLESLGNPEWVRDAVRQLITLSPTGNPNSPAFSPGLSNPAISRLQLLITDTKPRVELTEIPARILRLPTLSTLLRPELAPFLPNVSETRAIPGPSELARYVSETKGRAVATGFLNHGPIWVQLAEPASKESDTKSGRPPGGQPNLEAHPFLRSLGLTATVALPNDNDLVFIGPAHLGEIFKEHFDLDTKKKYTVLHPQQWPQLTAHLAATIVAIEPSREIIRLLANGHPMDALWMHASIPYPKDEGIVVTPVDVHRYTLGTETPGRRSFIAVKS